MSLALAACDSLLYSCFLMKVSTLMISVIPFLNLSYMIVGYEDHIIFEALVSFRLCGMIVRELEKVILGALS